MGYESRLYIVNNHKLTDYAEVIARFDCSKMGYDNGWQELFDKPFKGVIYAEDGNTEIKKDGYGHKLMYADFPSVINWLEKEIGKNTLVKYRRLEPLLSLLKGFDLSQWMDGEMQIVHYGY